MNLTIKFLKKHFMNVFISGQVKKECLEAFNVYKKYLVATTKLLSPGKSTSTGNCFIPTTSQCKDIT